MTDCERPTAIRRLRDRLCGVVKAEALTPLVPCLPRGKRTSGCLRPSQLCTDSNLPTSHQPPTHTHAAVRWGGGWWGGGWWGGGWWGGGWWGGGWWGGGWWGGGWWGGGWWGGGWWVGDRLEALSSLGTATARQVSDYLRLVSAALRGLWLVWLAVLATVTAPAGPLPPKPATHVEDRAGMIDAGTAQSLRQKLEQFERDTSNQIVVATFPRIPEGEALEDFTVRTAEAWGVGRAAPDNGVVLFVFRDDRKIRIEVGYGLEGRIPDSVAGRIIANEMTPRFRAGNPGAGISAAVDALIAASKGEYTGSGRTVAEEEQDTTGAIVFLVFMLLMIVFLFFVFRNMGRDTVYQRSGRRSVWIPSTGGWTSGGGFGSGGSSGGGFGGGGGFSGGGGSFGGGGASGGW